MALTAEQVGLIFKLQADSKQAKSEFEKFKTELGKLGQEFDDAFVRKAFLANQKFLSGLGDTAKKSNSIVRESVESISSEIIESFGVDGDVANMIANQLVVLKNSALLVAVGITAAVALVGAAFIAAANKAAELGDKIGDLQQVTGLTAETLSGLNVAAMQEGKTLDNLSGALTTFNKNLLEAQRGSKEFQFIFKQLGVDFRGNVDQALRQAIERLAEMESGARRTAIAQKVFGDNVQEVITILANLEGGIDKAIVKAKELGLFFDEEAVRSAQSYKDQLNQLDLQYQGLTATLGNLVIPAFTGLVFVVNESLKAINGLLRGTRSLKEALLEIVLLSSLLLRQDVLANLAGILSEEGKKEPDFKLPPVGGGTKKKKADKFDIEAELAQSNIRIAKIGEDLQAKLDKQAKQALDREVTLIKLREQAEEEHRRRLEQLEEESAERTIAIIEREAEQRVITEEQAAEQIGAIRIAAFANRELQLKAEIESLRNRLAGISEEEVRAELLAQEQEFLDELELLQERRAAIEEKAVNDVIDARRRDLENLIQTSEQMRRLREEQLQQLGFSGAAAEAIAGLESLLGRTLTFGEAFRVVLQGIVAEARTTLPQLSEVFLQSTQAITDSLGAMISAFISGQSSLRQAVAAFYRAALQPLVDFLLKKARIEFALGLADLAAYNFAGAAKHFLAGAALSAAAGLINAGGSAIAGGGTVAPSSGFGGGTNQQSGPRIIEQGDRSPREPQVIIIRAEMQEGVIVRRVQEDYRANGGIRQMIRGDLVGEQGV